MGVLLCGNKCNVPGYFTHTHTHTHTHAHTPGKREMWLIRKKKKGKKKSTWSSSACLILNHKWDASADLKNTFAKKTREAEHTETLSHCMLTSGFLTPGVQLVSACNKSTSWPLVTLPYTRQIFWASPSVCWQLRHRDSEGKTKRSYIILRLCQPWPQRTTINLITTSMWPTRTELCGTIIMACAACFPATASAAWC